MKTSAIRSGPLFSKLFNLLFLFLEPVGTLGAGIYALINPGVFASLILDIAAKDATTKFFSGSFGVMLVVVSIMQWLAIYHGSSQVRFWTIFSLFIGDLLVIGGYYASKDHVPVAKGLLFTVGASVVFAILNYWYDSESGQCTTWALNSDWINTWDFLDNATYAGVDEYYPGKQCDLWLSQLGKYIRI